MFRCWAELIKAVHHYLHDVYEAYPENPHEIRVINALIKLKESLKP